MAQEIGRVKNSSPPTNSHEAMHKIGRTRFPPARSEYLIAYGFSMDVAKALPLLVLCSQFLPLGPCILRIEIWVKGCSLPC